MAYYELKCSECGTHFDVELMKDEKLSEIWCPSCSSENFDVEGFDDFQNLSLRKLSLRIVDMELRIQALESEMETLETDIN